MLKNPQISCRIDAPVGSQRDLVACLVRRLLENDTNSSFVHQLANASVGLDLLLDSPVQAVSGTIISAAALATGNTLFAKPAEQTPGVALEAFACCMAPAKPAALAPDLGPLIDREVFENIQKPFWQRISASNMPAAKVIRSLIAIFLIANDFPGLMGPVMVDVGCLAEVRGEIFSRWAVRAGAAPAPRRADRMTCTGFVPIRR